MITRPVSGILKKASDNVQQSSQESTAKAMQSKANNAFGMYSNVALKAMEILGGVAMSSANRNKIR